MPAESKVFVLEEDDEVEDEYGEIMGQFVQEAEKDMLSQVRARSHRPHPWHDGG
eukprot:SAG25_NODE_152_length_13602_cov_15.382878_7_plen_54_part_00